MGELKDEAQRSFGLDLPIDAWAKEECIAEEEIRSRLNDDADRLFAQRAARYGPEIWRQVEKGMRDHWRVSEAISGAGADCNLSTFSKSHLYQATATRRSARCHGCHQTYVATNSSRVRKHPASVFELSRWLTVGTGADLRRKRAGAMDLVDLRYLLMAVETGSLLHAAQSLGIKPSTISRRITRLEDELGVTIVERGAFGVRLTAAGRDVMIEVRRGLDAIDNVIRSGKTTGAAKKGRLRLGVRMPPIGQPLQPLLASWRTRHPGVVLTLHELNDNEIFTALVERALDAAFVASHTLRPGAATEPLYRERVVAALPAMHGLASYDSLTWDQLRTETFLTQGWDGSHAARDFYASFLGEGVRFSPHPAGKQSIMALVGAGFGITLATRSQSEVTFPGVVYKPIAEDDAWLQVELAWLPTSQDAAVGRFVAFMRDEARSRNLL